MRASRGTATLPRVPRDHAGGTDVGEELERSTARQLAPDTGLQRDAGMGAV